jgi:hypothetical protein
MSYTTEAKIEAYLGEIFDTTTVPTSSAITDYIAWATALINKETGTAFESTTVTDSIFNAVTMEYEGLTALKMPKKPIVSVTNFYVDEVALGSNTTTTWTARTEGRVSTADYVIIADDGLLAFHHDAPTDGILNIKSTYVYGYSTLPADVEKLATLLVVREILRAKLANSTYSSSDNITVGPISISKASSSGSVGVKELQEEIDEAWKVVGRFKSISY